MILERNFRSGEIVRAQYCTERRILIFTLKLTHAHAFVKFAAVPVEVFRGLPTGNTFGVFLAEKLACNYAREFIDTVPHGFNPGRTLAD